MMEVQWTMKGLLAKAAHLGCQKSIFGRCLRGINFMLKRSCGTGLRICFGTAESLQAFSIVISAHILRLTSYQRNRLK